MTTAVTLAAAAAPALAAAALASSAREQRSPPAALALATSTTTPQQQHPAAEWDVAACNVSGAWCYLPAPAWQPLAFHEDASGRFEFTRSEARQPDAPWLKAEGVLRDDGTLSIDYGCGPSFPCEVNGTVNAACNTITVVGKGVAFSRHCPPAPQPEPVLPRPRSFATDAAWLANASTVVFSSSQQGMLFTPNMQPGGYGGQYTRDYTYGLLHTPAVYGLGRSRNLTLSHFIWTTEQTLLAQRPADGQIPDAIVDNGAGGLTGIFSGDNTWPGAKQYCTFPPGSPLPRPSCCSHKNCSTGSMDNAAFAVFNVLFLVREIETARGAADARQFLMKWLPALLRGLATIPTGGPNGRALAYNSPDSPVVGYGFEDTVVKTGSLNFASLLALEATATLCHAVRHATQGGPRGGKSAQHAAVGEELCAWARNISAELAPALWEESVGMFRPATGIEGNLTDVWGSAYAASLDGTHTMLGASDTWPQDVPPPVTPAQRGRIVTFLASHHRELFAAGQVRHLPRGQSWTQSYCVPKGSGVGSPACGKGFNYRPGQYQNGGFWATPVHHVWPLLHRDPSTRPLACKLLRDFVTAVSNVPAGDSVMHNFNEWVDVEAVSRGAPGYVASASNAAAAARAMAAAGGCEYSKSS